MAFAIAPPIPRPNGNSTLQLKLMDDSTKAASVNLKNSLVPDPKTRVFPLSYNERTQMVIKPEENMLQIELDRFHKEAT